MSNFSQLVQLLIQEEMNGNPRHEIVLDPGDTPKLLVEHAGFSDLKLIMTGAVVGKACFDHAISTSILKRLPEILGSPKAIYKSATHTDSTVVLTFEVKGESPIIVPLHKNQRVGRAKVNKVASVYAKEGPDPAKKWEQAGLLLWEK